MKEKKRSLHGDWAWIRYCLSSNNESFEMYLSDCEMHKIACRLFVTFTLNLRPFPVSIFIAAVLNCDYPYSYVHDCTCVSVFFRTVDAKIGTMVQPNDETFRMQMK